MITIIVLTYDSPTRCTCAQSAYYGAFVDVRLIIIEGGTCNYGHKLNTISSNNCEYYYLPGKPYSFRLRFAKELVKDDDIVISLNDDEFYAHSSLKLLSKHLESGDCKFLTGIPYTYVLDRAKLDLTLYEWQPPFSKHRFFKNDSEDIRKRVAYLARNYLPVYYYSLMRGESWKALHDISIHPDFTDSSYAYVKELYTCLKGAIIGKAKVMPFPFLLRNIDPQKDFVSWATFFFDNDFRMSSIKLLSYTISNAKGVTDLASMSKIINDYYIEMAEKGSNLSNDPGFWRLFADDVPVYSLNNIISADILIGDFEPQFVKDLIRINTAILHFGLDAGLIK